MTDSFKDDPESLNPFTHALRAIRDVLETVLVPDQLDAPANYRTPVS